MDQKRTKVNKNKPGISSFNRISMARAWMNGDRSMPEPFLSAELIRLLLIEESGRGRGIESLLAMAETGALPAYRDTSRKTKQGANPILFRWSEVRALLLGGVRTGGTSIIVPIVSVKPSSHTRARS